MVENSLRMLTGLAKRTSPTFLDSSRSTGAYSTENLLPAVNSVTGIPVVMPPINSTLYTVFVPSFLPLPRTLMG